MCLSAKSRRLKAGARPSLFSWLKTNPKQSLPQKKKEIEELNAILQSELTDIASEREGKFDLTDEEDFVSRGTHVCLHYTR